MALFGWGIQPGDNRSMGEVFYDRLMGNRRQEWYVVAPQEKPKKAKRAWFIWQKPPPTRNHAGGQIVRDMMSEVNQRIIREDNWRRDQGGGAFVSRRGWGVSFPDIDPGPPAGFQDTPQIYGPPGGYWDGNGMWHDEGR